MGELIAFRSQGDPRTMRVSSEAGKNAGSRSGGIFGCAHLELLLQLVAFLLDVTLSSSPLHELAEIFLLLSRGIGVKIVPEPGVGFESALEHG